MKPIMTSITAAQEIEYSIKNKHLAESTQKSGPGYLSQAALGNKLC
jgi:hypothetical protein